MNAKLSTSQFEKIIDESVKTAIIYSLPNIEVFTIELREKGQSSFLLEGKEPKHFYSLGEARLAAINAGVKKAYLAMTTLYDEPGSPTSSSPADKYDYMPINLEKMTY